MLNIKGHQIVANLRCRLQRHLASGASNHQLEKPPQVTRQVEAEKLSTALQCDLCDQKL